MKKIILFALGALVIASCAKKQETMEQLTDRVFTVAAQQFKLMDERLGETDIPRSLNPDGTVWNSDYKWWCSGFFPGSCWYVYEYTGDEEMKVIADRNTRKLDEIPANVDNHDLGFMIWCSYGNGLRLTGDSLSYIPVIKAGAEKLAARFNPVCKVTQSWAARPESDWKFPVIIDNMMNLELLEEGSRLFNAPIMDSIARTHANTTIINHFRPDYTTFHVVDYDPETGEVRHRQTAQGHADDSTWGRGESWAFYGYTMMYRETGVKAYLDQAEHIAEWLTANLPEDGVTYWDFNAPDIPDALRDASAAAVMASAYTQLCTLTEDSAKAGSYKAMAEKILRTLASEEYLAEPGTNGNFLLKHSVGHFHKNSEVDVPLTYADYYFLEALLKFRCLNTEN